MKARNRKVAAPPEGCQKVRKKQHHQKIKYPLGKGGKGYSLPPDPVWKYFRNKSPEYRSDTRSKKGNEQHYANQGKYAGQI